MSETKERREAAYWLALAFQLKGESARARNGLVLNADRRERLGLLDLMDLDSDRLPAPLQPFASTHRHLREAEGRVSAQAFLVQRLRDAGVAVVPVTRPEYPRHLAERLTPEKAPTVLLVKGNLDLLREPGVAISGSRKAGKQGLAFARAMGAALARAGLTLVSGLAAGVDRESLEGALGAGGRAIGVAAEGILNAAAARRPEVAEGRLTVVSQFAPTQRWAPWAAMQRNHTIAALSRALVIGDCVAQGGTTEQFGIHRNLGLPVFLRRGAGEGAMVSELGRHPGVTEIPWDAGDVRCPDLPE